MPSLGSCFIPLLHISLFLQILSQSPSLTAAAADSVKRYSFFRSDLGKRFAPVEGSLPLSEEQGNSQAGQAENPLNRLTNEEFNAMANEIIDHISANMQEDGQAEKRYSQFRSDFGKRLYRSDFGKRMYRSDFGKRFDGLDLDKSFYNADQEKRRMFRSDFGKRLYRSDFGKRSFRNDLDQRFSDEEAYQWQDEGKRAMFRSDLGKRASPTNWWYSRRVFRSDLGKRSGDFQ